MTPKNSKPSTKKSGTVTKVIQSVLPSIPEKAEIQIQGADHLYGEIRIDNELENCKGKKVKLKRGAVVDVAVEAEEENTEPNSQ